MTRDEILAMPAGKDIDDLVDEFVFGKPTPKDNNTILYIRNSKSYSTDISAAWEVVNAMEKYSCDFAIKKGVDAWSAIVGGGAWICDAETAPLAICQAALLAVMEDE
jgi:hypothetical protein